MTFYDKGLKNDKGDSKFTTHTFETYFKQGRVIIISRNIADKKHFRSSFMMVECHLSANR